MKRKINYKFAAKHRGKKYETKGKKDASDVRKTKNKVKFFNN